MPEFNFRYHLPPNIGLGSKTYIDKTIEADELDAAQEMAREALATTSLTEAGTQSTVIIPACTILSIEVSERKPSAGVGFEPSRFTKSVQRPRQ